MSARNNHSSFRYSDEVKSIVEKQKGESFADKFENMCIEFEKSVKEREKLCSALDQKIKDKEQSILKLSGKIQDLITMEHELSILFQKLKFENAKVYYTKENTLPFRGCRTE